MVFAVKVKLCAGAHRPCPSSKHMLDGVCKELLLQLVYIAISQLALSAAAISSKGIVALELVVSENHVVGEDVP